MGAPVCIYNTYSITIHISKMHRFLPRATLILFKLIF